MTQVAERPRQAVPVEPKGHALANPANQLTVLRIILSFVFMGLVFRPGVTSKVLALACFLLASLTDYLDGRIARARGLVSGFGRLMDPIADKVLTLAAFVSFVQLDLIRGWMVVLIFSRDILITTMRLAMPAGAESVSARFSGKLKTILQFALITGVLIFLVVRETSFWNPGWNDEAKQVIEIGTLFIVAVTLWSGASYAMRHKDVFE